MKTFTKLCLLLILIMVSVSVLVVQAQKNVSTERSPANNKTAVNPEQLKIELLKEQGIDPESLNKEEELLKVMSSSHDKITQEQMQVLKEMGFNEDVMVELEKEGITNESFQDPEVMGKAEKILMMNGLLNPSDVNKDEYPSDAASGYTFSQLTGTYTPITGGTVVASSIPGVGADYLDDVNYSAQAIPFTFMFNGVSYTEFNINTNGNITFGTTIPSTTNYSAISSSTAYAGAIAPFSKDLDGRFTLQATTTLESNVLTDVTFFGGVIVDEEITATNIPAGTTITAFDAGAGTITLSANATATGTTQTCVVYSAEIRTETLGSAPNRIHVIQYTNFKRYSGSSYYGELYNFQIRLYETTNLVEIVYGSIVGNSTSTTGQVGLRGASNADFNNRTTTTDWTLTTAGGTNLASCTMSSTVYPPAGLTFTFTPQTTPFEPYNPSPADVATGVLVDAVLTWNFGANTTTYDLFFGTNNPPLTKVEDGEPAGATGTWDPPLGYETTYYWQVIAKNASKAETAGPVWSFETECEPVSVPWLEDFEGMVTVGSKILPDCWGYENVVGTSGPYSSTTTGTYYGPHSGTHFLYTYYNNSTWVFTPGMSLTSGVYYDFSFWMMNKEPASSDYFIMDVAYGSDQNGAGMTNVLATGVVCDNDTMIKVNYVFTPASTGIYYFGVKSTSNSYAAWYLSLDDFAMDLAPDCPNPASPYTDNITTMSADLNWTQGATESYWDIEWGEVPYTPTGSPSTGFNDVTTTTVNLGGLEVLKTYDWYVRADCGGDDTDVSEWIGPINFQTLANPLSGTYTINSGVPTGGTNFISFTDFATALNQGGVAGPVTVNVVAASGPYNEQIILGEINNSSATNTVTINGNGEKLEFTSIDNEERATLKLNGSDYLIVDNLIIEALGDYSPTTERGFAVHLMNQADYCTFTNCEFIATQASTSSYYACFVASNSNTSATADGLAVSNLTVQNCSTSGGYYGLAISGPDATPWSDNNTIVGNEIKNFYYYGLYLQGLNNSFISENEISRPDRATVSTGYMIRLYENFSGTEITKNRIFDFAGSASSTSAAYGIYGSYLGASTGDELLIANNVVSGYQNMNGSNYGIYLSANADEGNFRIFHNTVSVDNTSHTGSSIVYVFYSTGTNSVVDIRNNIFSYTTNSTGTKYCMYFSGTTQTVTSNYNVLHRGATAGTNNTAYWGAAFATLADWKTANGGIYDQNSVDDDPLFVNPAMGDLSPSSAFVNNIGTNLLSFVPDDINGVARTATPDPGAYEFVPPSCLPPTLLPVTTVTSSSAELEWVDNNSPAATEWDIEVVLSGTSPTGTPTEIGVTDNPHTYNLNLDPATTYDWYVRAACSEFSSSTWSGPGTFTTACEAISTLPWLEDFEGMTSVGSKILPVCWSYENVVGTSGPYSSTTTGTYYGPHSGTHFLYTYYNNSTWIFTPEMSLTEGVSYDFSFWMMNKYPAASDYFLMDVAYGTDPNGAGMTNVLATGVVCDNDTYVQVSYTLIPATTGTYYLGVKSTSISYSAWYLSLDDFALDLSPTCPSPDDLSASGISSTGANLTWTSYSGDSDIEFGSKDFVPTGTPTYEEKTSPFGVSGLDPYTPYDFYVRDDCGGGDWSTWTGPYTFYTLPGPHTLPLFEDFEPDEDFTYFDNAPGNDMDWVLNTSYYHTGAQCAYNLYDLSNANILHETGILDLSAAPAVVLDFWQIAKTESNYDHCIIEISTDGGVNYTPLPLSSYTGSGNYHVPTGNAPYDICFDEDSYAIWGTEDIIPDNATWWQKESFNLNDYLTTDVRIRFRLDSDVSISRFGWLLDDISVYVPAFGTLDGYVYEYGTTTPIPSASIVAGDYSTTSGLDGYYSIPALLLGTYDVDCNATGYLGETATGVEIFDGITTTQNFYLKWSEIAVDPNSFTVNLPSDAMTDELMTITNDGTGPLSYSTSIDFISKASGKGTGDILADIDIQATNADNLNLGVEFDGTYYYVTGSNSGVAPYKLYKHDMTGALVATYDQPTQATSLWGMRDLAYDGVYIYGGSEDGFYQFDPATGIFTTLFTGNLGIDCIRALAYYPATGNFLTTNYSGAITEFTGAGTTVGTYTAPSGLTGMYGFAWDSWNDMLWIFDQSGPTLPDQLTTFYEYDMTAQATTGTSHLVPWLTGSTEQIAGGAFFSTNAVSGYAVLGGISQGTPVDRLFLMELNVTETWLSITANGSGTVAGSADGTVDVTLHFDATGYAVGTTKTANVIISSNALGNPTVPIPVTMNVVESQTFDFGGTDGWKIWSTYIDPLDTDMLNIFVPAYPNVEVIKDEDGLAAYPLWNLNYLNPHVVGEGYQVKLDAPANLTVYGNKVVPEITLIDIPTNWSLIAYLRDNPGNAFDMFNAIYALVDIMKNEDGGAAYFDYGLDYMGPMVPGQGYQIKMHNFVVGFTYPSNSKSMGLSNFEMATPEHYNTVLNTGVNHSLLIPENAWDIVPELGDEIAVFDINGNLVGSSVVQLSSVHVTIWGDDETTEVVEYMTDGSEFTIRLWHQANDSEEILYVNSWQTGGYIYEDNGLSIAKSVETGMINAADPFGLGESKTVLYQNVPNPFNNISVISFFVPEDTKVEILLYDMYGNMIDVLASEYYENGKHSIPINSNKYNAGTYLYRMVTGSYTETKYMIIN